MKVLYFYCFAVLCLVCGCKTTGGSQQQTESGQKPVNIGFVADSAYAYCQAQCDFGPRTMNSEAHERCAEWIKQKFEGFGCQVELQKADLRGYDGTVLKATNIIARTPRGEGERPTILVCAHWDSRPWADNDPDKENWKKPVMAANDGASGVSVMLELARLVQQHGDSLRVNIDFVCFDAEDWGIPQWSDAQDNGNSWALGAQHWAAAYASQSLQTSQHTPYEYGILLDMVGGQGARFYQEVMSKRYAKNIVDKVWAAAKVAGFGSVFPKDEGGQITDDHLPVNEVAKVPCIDIISYYPDCQQSSFGPTWHTVNDDMEHLDRATLQAVGQTMVQVLFSE